MLPRKFVRKGEQGPTDPIVWRRKQQEPIGSGEIESSHRYVIQKRLKISGAWWLEDNARAMLSLRVLRANEDWEDYWKQLELEVA